MLAGRLEIEFAANLARLSSDMQQAKGIVSNAAREMESAIASLKAAFAGLGLGLGLNQLIGMTDQYQKYVAQLKLATQSERELGVARADVRRISALAQTELGATGVLYARITNSTRELGKSQREVANLTETVMLSLKASGATASESASATLQLSQAFASGVLRGQEFNAVNEAAPRLMKALAEGMGVPIGQLRSMAEAGKLTSEVMANALPRALGELRKEAAEVQTISGAFQVLKNNVMEYVGTQANANGSVKVFTGLITLVAENLGVITAALSGLTAMKVAGWVIGLTTAFYNKTTALVASVQALQAERQATIAATGADVARLQSTLAFVAADRERVVLEMQAAQATIAATAAIGAQSVALQMNTAAKTANAAAIAELAALGKLQAATTVELAAAQGALTAAQTAGTGAATLASRALGLLGGPIGLITTLVGLGVTAWMMWGKSAEDANQKAKESTEVSTIEILRNLEKQNEKLRERLVLVKQAGEIAKTESPGTERMAELLKTINDLEAKRAELKSKGVRLDRDDQFLLDDSIQRYTQIKLQLEQQAAIKKGINDVGAASKAAEWLDKYATKTEQLNKELEKARKELGDAFSSDLEARIRKKYETEDKEAKKAAAEAKRMQELDSRGWVEKIENDEKEYEAGLIAAGKALDAWVANEAKMLALSNAEWVKSIDGTRKAYEDNLTALGKLHPSATLISDKAVKELNAFLDPAKAQSFGDALRESFGAAGGAVAGLTSALRNYGRAEAEIAKMRLEASKILDPEKRAKVEIALAEKSAAAQIEGFASMAGAAKGFFKEHSTGYKVMEGVEKTFRALQLALAVQNFVMQIAQIAGLTTATVVGDGVKAASGVASNGLIAAADSALLLLKIALGIANQANGEPYSAPARMAAMAGIMAGVAAIAGVAFSFGGGGGGASTVAADRQALQGTGTVLGDAEATSDSILNALEHIRDNSSDELLFTSRMLASLRAIESGIQGMATFVARSGLLTGKGADLHEGAAPATWRTGGNTFALADSGIIIGNRVGTTSNFVPQTVGQARTNLGANAYNDVERTHTGSFGGIWGNSYTAVNRDIVDLENSFKNDISRMVVSMADALGEAIEILTNGRIKADEVQSILDAINIDVTEISFANLKGDDIQNAIAAVFGVIGDNMVSGLIDSIPELEMLEQFQHVGEGAFETIIRVANGIERARAVLDLWGIAIIDWQDIVNKQGDVTVELIRDSVVAMETAADGTVSGMGQIIAAFDGTADDLVTLYERLRNLQVLLRASGADPNSLSEDMIKGAGGLSALEAGLQSFSENFFTEAERMNAASSELSTSFARLGITMPTTREGFRQLLESIDTSTAAGQRLYGSLVVLAPAFDTVASAAERTMDTFDALMGRLRPGYTDARRGLQLTSDVGAFMNANAWTRGMSADQVIAALRTISREDFSNYSRSNQGLILSILDLDGTMQDATTAFTLAAEQYRSVNDDVWDAYYGPAGQATRNAKAGIGNYLDGLLLGNKSPLNPMEQLGIAKGQYEKMLKLAQSGDLAGIQGLQGAADTYLNLARGAYASGSTYQDIFKTVFDALSKVSGTGDYNTRMLELQTKQHETQINIYQTLIEIRDEGPRSAAAVAGANERATARVAGAIKTSSLKADRR